MVRAVTGLPTTQPAVILRQAIEATIKRSADDRRRFASAERVDAYYVLYRTDAQQASPHWVIVIQLPDKQAPGGYETFQYLVDAGKAENPVSKKTASSPPAQTTEVPGLEGIAGRVNPAYLRVTEYSAGPFLSFRLATYGASSIVRIAGENPLARALHSNHLDNIRIATLSGGSLGVHDPDGVLHLIEELNHLQILADQQGRLLRVRIDNSASSLSQETAKTLLEQTGEQFATVDKGVVGIPSKPPAISFFEAVQATEANRLVVHETIPMGPIDSIQHQAIEGYCVLYQAVPGAPRQPRWIIVSTGITTPDKPNPSLAAFLRYLWQDMFLVDATTGKVISSSTIRVPLLPEAPGGNRKD
jgi:hypothetical protein